MKIKTGVFHRAIRTDPGNYGITGKVEYTTRGVWRFWSDCPTSLMVTLDRKDFRIPSLDRDNMLPAVENSRAERFNYAMGTLWDELAFTKHANWKVDPGSELGISPINDNKFMDLFGRTLAEINKSRKPCSST